MLNELTPMIECFGTLFHLPSNTDVTAQMSFLVSRLRCISRDAAVKGLALSNSCFWVSWFRDDGKAVPKVIRREC